MHASGQNSILEVVKKTWHRPDFAFFDTALEITAYAGRS
ncbi:pyrroloquinoline quinone precursor peptide PqqA [Nocardia sp. CS682]|nr:pyrroloquinoline quinone precursor peptide PqqA [Nocardia sp. CS682]QBS39082.1 pyrroloquinoline quinone precursor peptide PqqA [Nocardia sp. CS682]